MSRRTTCLTQAIGSSAGADHCFFFKPYSWESNGWYKQKTNKTQNKENIDEKKKNFSYIQLYRGRTSKQRQPCSSQAKAIVVNTIMATKSIVDSGVGTFYIWNQQNKTKARIQHNEAKELKCGASYQNR